MAKIDENGFTRERYQGVRRTIAKSWSDDGLPDVTDNTQSVPARIVSQNANQVERTEALAEAVLDSLSPYSAVGVQQDRLAPLMGKKRNKEAKAQVVLLVEADANGLTLPIGSQASDGTNKVETTAVINLLPNTSGSVQAQSVKPGDIKFTANSITKISTPVYGWKSVNNPLESTKGAPRETDTQLRFRMLKSSERKSSGTLGIFTALSELDGVTYAYVDDNNTDTTNAKGLIPHSVFPVVDGGNNDEIGAALLQFVSGGIDTNETIPGANIITVNPYNPANRKTVPVHFARPTDLKIFVEVNIQPDPILPPDYSSRIKAAIIAYFASLEIGTKILQSRLYGPINTVEGHEIISVKVGKSSPATGNEVVLLPFERPFSDDAAINIVVTP